VGNFRRSIVSASIALRGAGRFETGQRSGAYFFIHRIFAF